MSRQFEITCGGYVVELSDEQVEHARALLAHMPAGSTLAQAVQESPELWWDEFENNADFDVEDLDEEYEP